MPQPGQYRWLLPGGGPPPSRLADGRDGLEGPAFLGEINFRIALRGFQVDVPEPAADEIQLDAGLQQMHRARVSKGAGVDTFSCKGRLRRRRAGDRAAHDMTDSVPGEGLPLGADEDGRGRVAGNAAFSHERTEQPRGFWPQRADPFLAAFAEEPHLIGALELER